ncbi:SWIM-type [Hexamita inflata]|uniref:SWIM-type n=1 Tax=Hexamita inflata TaxID=28002 RepID=A0AA86Q804_9EUKA|nr:SWIM-type [Hexamita inflata]
MIRNSLFRKSNAGQFVQIVQKFIKQQQDISENYVKLIINNQFHVCIKTQKPEPTIADSILFYDMNAEIETLKCNCKVQKASGMICSHMLFYIIETQGMNWDLICTFINDEYSIQNYMDLMNTMFPMFKVSTRVQQRNREKAEVVEPTISVEEIRQEIIESLDSLPYSQQLMMLKQVRLLKQNRYIHLEKQKHNIPAAFTRIKPHGEGK